ncbi:Syntaxin-16 [Operophtera brumata]|uniref:Syntaxin-16 n=1 Tax=Operophtera brumata TaxID=104452 RepID=A0A0L7L260_OPEBR|nr:Syntaxin-16 [Operophtera brumata]
MVSRSLTEVYVLMRNNAIQGRQIFAEQGNENERVRLMRSGSRDLEAGDSHLPPPWTDALEEAHYVITRLRTKLSELQTRHERQIRRPALDDTSEQRHISRLTSELARLFSHAHTHISAIRRHANHGTLRTKLSELQTRHERQIRRPALDDTSEQRHISRLTSELARLFSHAHTHISAIRRHANHGTLLTKLSELQTQHERQIRRPALDDTSKQRHISRLTSELARLFSHAHTHISAIRRHANHVTNVVLALVTTLQDLSVTFRTAQSNYLKSLTSREERSNAYLDLPNFEELSLNDNELLPGLTNNQTDLLFSLPSTSGTQNNFIDDDRSQSEPFQNNILSQTQMLLMEEDNTKMVAEREEEVNKIVRSITDLNDVFKDLSHMVNEQGTVLDRIDYNIEQTQVQVHEGYKQLQKAERYQRKNRKMHCILVMATLNPEWRVLLDMARELQEQNF